MLREPRLEELGDLSGILKERVGLHLRPDGLGALRLAVLARYEDPTPPPVALDGYLGLLRAPEGEEELRRLLPLVTVGKTSFFRDERQFRALRAILPGMLREARAAGRPAAIWSAGCATGEEPYSIAMLAAEAGAAPGEIEILATDVNPEAVAQTRAGRFPARRGREIPPALAARWLEVDGDGVVVVPALRALVAARVQNLVSPSFPRPEGGAWDAIFCRNVIIYFDTRTAQDVLGRFHAGLAPGGWLFLGYSESLFRMFEGFELDEMEGAFLYRRPPGPPAPPESTPTPAPPPAARYAPGVVHRAAPQAAPGAGRLAFSPQELLDATGQLLASGRFGEARQRLERHLARGGEDLAVRLTLASLLAAMREPEAATRSYRAALRQEPLSAEAHLLYGVHLIGLSRLEEAGQELGRALFLDPDSAMAHYFLGRCREAQGDLARARLGYQNAIGAHARCPQGRSLPFVGCYPDLPEDGAPFARAAEYALAALPPGA